MVPYTTAESFNPEDLWTWMARYEEATGGRVLTLAHNGNMSNGIMFPVRSNPATGQPLTGDYARRRIRWEPLYEVTQIKGDGETHPLLSPMTRFADFETLALGNLNLTVVKTDEDASSRVRPPGAEGWAASWRSELGTNPLQVRHGRVQRHPHRAVCRSRKKTTSASTRVPSRRPNAGTTRWRSSRAGSMTAGRCLHRATPAVWATENTREALWDAMMRKEVYATTGPRILVRFFGGWDFAKLPTRQSAACRVWYTKGVPMGGDLRTAPRGKAPTFLVAALKDPLSGQPGPHPDRQGLAGHDGGETQEKVYDVVWGDAERRKPGRDGKLPPVGNTVDVKNATWTNTIGDPELLAVWTDPDFDASESAFYYARVIEIPTPRWTAYDAQRFGVKLDARVPVTIQERAYTSPIWYTP